MMFIIQNNVSENTTAFSPSYKSVAEEDFGVVILLIKQQNRNLQIKQSKENGDCKLRGINKKKKINNKIV